MRKQSTVLFTLLLSTSMLAACGGSGAGSTDREASSGTAVSSTAPGIESSAADMGSGADLSGLDGAEYVSVSVYTDGFGQLAAAGEGETLEFDDEFPSQSLMKNMEKGAQCSIAAKADEGYKLVKWIRDGEDFGSDETITITLEEDTELVAIFGEANPNEDAQLADLKTMGDLLDNVSETAMVLSDEYYVYAFELRGNYYRAFVGITEDIYNAYSELDFLDEQYEEKFDELMRPLPVERIEDLSKETPDEAELAALAGKTVGELLDDEWLFYSYDFEAMEFYAYHEIFDFRLLLEGEVADTDNFDDEDLRDLKVISVEYIGLGDLTNTNYEAPEAAF